jgi:hypothetical protein
VVLREDLWGGMLTPGSELELACRHVEGFEMRHWRVRRRGYVLCEVRVSRSETHNTANYSMLSNITTRRLRVTLNHGSHTAFRVVDARRYFIQRT